MESQRHHAALRIFQPRWHGEPLAGRTILLHAEQGFGRHLAVYPLRLAAGLPGSQGAGGLPTNADCNCCEAVGAWRPSFRWANRCRRSICKCRCPGCRPCFAPRPTTCRRRFPICFPIRCVERWRRELSADPAFKVGIVWQGEPRHKRDYYRSIPLAEFAPLADVAGVRLYSLQKQNGRDQLQRLPWAGRVVDLADRLQDFTDTAAVMQCLDLVVTCDTAAAHLAGAVGARCGWRFFGAGLAMAAARDNSPWYPTMRLVRQSAIGRWSDVFQRIARDAGACGCQPTWRTTESRHRSTYRYLSAASRHSAPRMNSASVHQLPTALCLTVYCFSPAI